jgi:dCTP deaminase
LWIVIVAPKKHRENTVTNQHKFDPDTSTCVDCGQTVLGMTRVMDMNCPGRPVKKDVNTLALIADMKATEFRPLDNSSKPVGLMPDWMIERDVKIVPFEKGIDRPGVISYGVTSYGYDIRAAYKWRIFTNTYGAVIDPKNFDTKAFVEIEVPEHRENYHQYKSGKGGQPVCTYCDEKPSQSTSDTCPKHPNNWREPILIPPNSFALTESLEYLEIPRDVLVIVVGKSTLARCGLIVNVTPLEPEWRGHVTMEVSNTSTLPVKVYPGEGLAQFLFFRAAAPCERSYVDKKGRYQDQKGITLPKVS